MESGAEKEKHLICLKARRELQITGVTDVRAFDEREIVLETTMGVLFVRGQQLHVKKLLLEQGELILDGEIQGLLYSDKGTGKKQETSTLRRLFG